MHKLQRYQVLILLLLISRISSESFAESVQRDLRCYLVKGTVTACAQRDLPTFELSGREFEEVRCGTIDSFSKEGVEKTSIPIRFSYRGKTEAIDAFCRTMSGRSVVLMYEASTTCRKKPGTDESVCTVSTIVTEVEDYLKQCERGEARIGDKTYVVGCDGQLRELGSSSAANSSKQ